MNRELAYLPEVSRDFVDAVAYYEALSPTAALHFEEAFARAETEVADLSLTSKCSSTITGYASANFLTTSIIVCMAPAWSSSAYFMRGIRRRGSQIHCSAELKTSAGSHGVRAPENEFVGALTVRGTTGFE
jgi:hypothetical protein